jgi:hypothetical protein
VHHGEHLGELHPDRGHLGGPQARRRAQPRRGAARRVRHGDVRRAGLRRVVVEARQRRMVEGLEQHRLAREAEDVVGVFGPQELQDDVVAGAAVHREVRVRLGAGARQPDQLVAAIDPRRGRAALRVRREHCLERAPQLGRGLRAVLGLERQRGDQDALQVVRRVTTRMRLAQRLERLLGQLAPVSSWYSVAPSPNTSKLGFGSTRPASSGR